jgi:hypothetical protein
VPGVCCARLAACVANVAAGLINHFYKKTYLYDFYYFYANRIKPRYDLSNTAVLQVPVILRQYSHQNKAAETDPEE